MKKIYYLKTCNTCARILKELKPSSEFILQDIKAQEITTTQLDEMHKLSGSYESLFSKRANLYKAMDLKNQELTERDYKQYLLEHYTFLKRPVIICESKIFIGNSQKNIKAAKTELEKS